MISVTRALKIIAQSYGPDDDVIEAAGIRGTLVHSACAAYATGYFPCVSLEVDGYVESFRTWFDANVDRVAMEPEIYLEDAKLGFYGHSDFGHLILKNGINALIDVKTPLQYRKTWALQLAAYHHLVRRVAKVNIIKPGVLMLDPDGGPAKLIWVEEREGMTVDQLFSLFHQALNLNNFMGGNNGF